MEFELGKNYKAILEDGSEITFEVIGGENMIIQLSDKTEIPILKLPPYVRIELLLDK